MKKKQSKTAARSKLALAALFVFGVFAYLGVNLEQYKDDYININTNSIFKVLNLARTGGGTGFVIRAQSGKNYILTNAHVCGVADSEGRVALQEKDGTLYESHVKKVFKKHDLCLIDAKSDWTPISIARDSYVGENIYVVGYPGLEPLSMVKGQLRAYLNIQMEAGRNKECEEGEESVDPGPIGQMFGVNNICVKTFYSQPITANIYPGNSGSPVMDNYGNVVGVAFASNEYHQGYIVPLSYIKEFLKEVEK